MFYEAVYISGELCVQMEKLQADLGVGNITNRLGLSQEDLDMCAKEYQHEKQLQAPEMLRLRQMKQTLAGDTSKTTLEQVLKEMKELEALSCCKREKEGLQEAKRGAVIAAPQIEEMVKLKPEMKQQWEKATQTEDLLEFAKLRVIQEQRLMNERQEKFEWEKKIRLIDPQMVRRAFSNMQSM